MCGARLELGRRRCNVLLFGNQGEPVKISPTGPTPPLISVRTPTSDANAGASGTLKLRAGQDFAPQNLDVASRVSALKTAKTSRPTSATNTQHHTPTSRPRDTLGSRAEM